MSDDERPRKSWRDIDRNKDRSRHRQEERAQSKRKEQSTKSYRAALDRLFESGKIAELVQQRDPNAAPSEEGEHRLKVLARISNATNRDEVTAAVDTYIARWGALPDDLEVLGRMIEHRDPNRQLEAMQRIEGLIEQARPKRTRAMLGQLRMIRDVADDPEMVAIATRLIERLS